MSTIKWEFEGNEGLKIQCMELPLPSYCYICSSEITDGDEICVLYSAVGKPLMGGHTNCFEKVTNLFELALFKMDSERRKKDEKGSSMAVPDVEFDRKTDGHGGE